MTKWLAVYVACGLLHSLWNLHSGEAGAVMRARLPELLRGPRGPLIAIGIVVGVLTWPFWLVVYLMPKHWAPRFYDAILKGWRETYLDRAGMELSDRCPVHRERMVVEHVACAACGAVAHVRHCAACDRRMPRELREAAVAEQTGRRPVCWWCYDAAARNALASKVGQAVYLDHSIVPKRALLGKP